jgi:hypothetical protein
MNELLLNDESLTTRDAAYAEGGLASRAPIPMPAEFPSGSEYVSGPVGEEAPAGFPATASSSAVRTAGALFPSDELQSFRTRWDSVQTSFVDEPRQAVEEADSLVANVVKRLEEQFSADRQRLELQWEGGGEASTEDLRQALKRYRSLFERLLSV